MAEIPTSPLPTEADVRVTAERIARTAPATDIHTHLYPPAFGELLLWGIDDVLTYHYLIAEVFRWTAQPYGWFWNLPKPEQADYIWRTLFLERSPLSEAGRGVVTILQRLGLDVTTRDLSAYRAAFVGRTAHQHTDFVLRQANLRQVVMTNDPFDVTEQTYWEQGQRDPRFYAALRVDALLGDWNRARTHLRQQGYRVEAQWGNAVRAEVQRFVREWATRTQSLYLAVALPDTFRYPEATHRATMLDEVLIPVCQELQLPLALMIGARRQANPQLRLAGDMSGRADVGALETLCRRYPEQKFISTLLARENQHDLAVLARKFRNLHIFGCWWFLQNPSLIEEMTRFRLELLGTSFTPLHSDARVLEHLIYKWDHARDVLGRVLADKYAALHRSGWPITEAEIARDVDELYGGAFWRFIGRSEMVGKNLRHE